MAILGTPYSITQNVLRTLAHMFPYNISTVHQLQPQFITKFLYVPLQIVSFQICAIVHLNSFPGYMLDILGF